MRELSLFTGAGGGLLGTHLLGWTPIGYVEFNDYCQRVIRQRIDDGILPIAPIFTDVREFVQSGAAREYRGFADVVTGGFPCQPFSAAGKQLGADDPRNMWPAMAHIVDVVRPRFVLVENVPGLLNSGYFGTIVGDLAKSGYCVRWEILSAAELGAPHRRDRLWIVANSDMPRRVKQSSNQPDYYQQRHDTPSEQAGQYKQSDYFTGVASHTADTDSQRIQGRRAQTLQGEQRVPWGENLRSFEDLRARPDIPEPLLHGVDDGVAHWMDRLKAIGNGQVPAVVAAAWQLLTQDIERTT